MTQPKNRLSALRELPSMPAEGTSIDDLLARAEQHLEHFAALFDAVPGAWWHANADHEHEAAYSPAPHTEAPTLLDLLCFLRDEEAWVVGRRLAQLYEADGPEFEHLTFERASDYANPPYRDHLPGRAFGELFKNRMAWLQLARGELELLSTRSGTAPREEGGVRVTLEMHLRATLRRDLDALRLANAMRHALDA